METPDQPRQLSPLTKKLIFIAIFFVITPIALMTSLLSLTTLSGEKPETTTAQQPVQAGVQVYASLPSDVPSVSASVEEADARPEIIRDYMDQFDSPLTPYADYIVEMSDTYDLDYRLLVAIARKESGLCRIIPPGGHNCWGWGIHTAGTLGFDSYEESIKAVAQGLNEDYHTRGLRTVDEIMSRWIPHSPEGIWAEDVKFYMSQMQ